MPDPRVLPIYPWPMAPEDHMRLVAAKRALNIDFQVTIVEGLPGSPGRMLALRTTPPFLAEHCLVTNLDRPEGLQAALRVVLSDEPDDRVMLEIDQLRAWFKTPHIYEITEESRRSLDDLVDHDGPRFVEEKRRYDPND